MFPLGHEATWHTGLEDWYGSQSCVMQNGDVMIWGRRRGEKPAFYLHNLHGNMIRSFETLCEHDKHIHVLPLMIQNKDYLAVSCRDCHVIRLLNVETKQVTEAFRDGRINLSIGMTLAKEGTLYTIHNWILLTFDCSTPHFKLKHTTGTDLDWMFTIHSVPTHNIIVLTRPNKLPRIRAVSSDTSTVVWETTGKVKGISIDPWGIAYCYEHDVVLIGDGKNKRILILQPQSGQCLQVFDVSQHVPDEDIHIYGNQLIYHHYLNEQVAVSVCTVSISYMLFNSNFPCSEQIY